MPSEADALRDKTVEGSDQTRRGVSAIFKPKRKRAYWRALKQGKMWAVAEKQFRDMMTLINRSMFAPSPFSKFVSMSEIVKEKE